MREGPMKQHIYKVVAALNGPPCKTCHGSGSDWPVRKDGKPDRRFVFPRGPCPDCRGTRTAA